LENIDILLFFKFIYEAKGAPHHAKYRIRKLNLLQPNNETH